MTVARRARLLIALLAVAYLMGALVVLGLWATWVVVT